MYRRFLNARSPLRGLEKGLHGGLGDGNLGLVLAAPGVGKTAFLVGLALDHLLRDQAVLHVTLEQSVAHVRAYYDTVFADLAASTQLEGSASAHLDVDRLRSIRAYPPTLFDAKHLREAISFEVEAGRTPRLVVLEGLDVVASTREEMNEWRGIARGTGAEIWLSSSAPQEQIPVLPETLAPLRDLFGVILVLEPGDTTVTLRALKSHEEPDVDALHVALEPKTLLLVRS